PREPTDTAVHAALVVDDTARRATCAGRCTAVEIHDHAAPTPRAAAPIPLAARLTPLAASDAAVETPVQIVCTVWTALRTPSTAVVMTFQVLNAATTPSTARVKFFSVSGDKPASQPVTCLTTSSALAPGPDSPDSRLSRVFHRSRKTPITVGAVCRT